MKTFCFKNEIEVENLESLINDIEEKKDKEITIYFCSGGGSVSAADAYIDYFNYCGRTFTFIAYDEISSAATRVFFKSKTKRRILPTAWAIIHLPDSKFSLNELLKRDPLTVGLREWHDRFVEKTIALYRSWGIPESEIKIIEKGEDVFLDAARLREIDERLKKADK